MPPPSRGLPQSRRNEIAQSLGFRNAYHREQARAELRNNGYMLSAPANRRAFQGYLRSEGRRAEEAAGLPVSGRAAQPTAGLMERFAEFVFDHRLNRSPRGRTVTEYLEDQDWYDPEEENWDEFYDQYAEEGEQ